MAIEISSVSNYIVKANQYQLKMLPSTHILFKIYCTSCALSFLEVWMNGGENDVPNVK